MVVFVFSLVLLASIVISILSRRGMVKDSINDVLVASGSFGPALFFFIMVGEMYTTGTVLGAPGSIYSKGAGYGFWFINYIMLAYTVSYFISPAIWRLGRLSNAATVGDILGWRFDSKLVQLVVAFCGIVFLVPNIQLQLTGLGIVFQYLDLGINFQLGVMLSIVLSFVMIVISGIRAPAYVSILKDFLLLFAIIIVGCVCIAKTDGGVYGVFSAVAEKMPQLLTVPDSPPTAGLTFTMSTIAFQMLGYNLYPLLVAGTLTSTSERNIRRNVIIMPIYMLMFPFLVISAYFALLSLPGLEKPDYAILAVAMTYLPAWVVGLIAGGVALTGTLVISVNALAIGGLFSKNVLQVVKPNASQRAMVGAVRVITAIVLVLGGIMAIYMPSMMATIITIGYNGISQMLVAFVFAFFWKRGNKEGIVAGMLVAIAFLFFYTGAMPFALNKGFCALILNFMVAVPVTLLTRPADSAVARFAEFQKAPVNRPVGRSLSARS